LSDLHTPTPFMKLDGQPTFEEAWQAEALAIAQNLINDQVITGSDWANALGAALQVVQRDQDNDTVAGYYEAVLLALEQVVQSNCEISAESINAQKMDWVDAYQSTPHGQPVLLKQTNK